MSIRKQPEPAKGAKRLSWKANLLFAAVVLAAAVLRFGLDRLVLSQINTSAWPDGVYRQDCYDLLLGFWQLTDVLLWLALTAALIATAALLRGRKAGSAAAH